MITSAVPKDKCTRSKVITPFSQFLPVSPQGTKGFALKIRTQRGARGRGVSHLQALATLLTSPKGYASKMQCTIFSKGEKSWCGFLFNYGSALLTLLNKKLPKCLQGAYHPGMTTAPWPCLTQTGAQQRRGAPTLALANRSHMSSLSSKLQGEGFMGRKHK